MRENGTMGRIELHFNNSSSSSCCSISKRRSLIFNRLLLWLSLAAIAGGPPPSAAYRGTIPIFPDVVEGRKKAAEAAASIESHQRLLSGNPQSHAAFPRRRPAQIYDKPRILFDGEKIKALDDITADIQGPGSVALVGDTGAGKTTMLKCLAGLEQPTSGQIEVSGLRKAVYVGKDTARTKGRSVRRLVSDEVAQHLPGQRRHDVEVATNTILGALDLHRVSRTLDRDLSGGEVYRFALAMALAKGCSSPTPPVLLLDGFFDKSDTRVRYGVEFTLFDLQRTMGVMLVFTAHSYQIVIELAKQVVELTKGRITEVSVHEKSRYARYQFEQMRMELERKMLERLRRESSP